MKAFLLSCAVAVIIAVVAGVALDRLGYSSANVYSTSNVRL